MKSCIYCGEQKSFDQFSDEHIWPNALGGDYLPHDVWRTDDVCQRCNSVSGLFVDGAFIRSWMGQAELSNGALEYLAGRDKPGAIPLNYLGPIQDIPAPRGHVADYWAGPCGANIIHIRPDNGDEQWTAYAGGDPKAKKAAAGRAYMALTSQNEFWVTVSLLSFKHHFDRAERFVVNMELPPNWSFKAPDRNDPVQAEDMTTIDAVIKRGRDGDSFRGRISVSADLGNRLLSKLGLAVGYKLLGAAFLETDNAKNLRWGLREANIEKRKKIPLRGSSYLSGRGLRGMEAVLAWPGGWVLMVKLTDGKLSLSVLSPSGRAMSVLISDEQTLVDGLDLKFRDGVVWITAPVAEEAVGPIMLSEYVAHQAKFFLSPMLAKLASRRGDTATLPLCR